MAKLRVVLDCNAFLRAFISPKSLSEQILKHAERKDILLFISRDIVSELEEVLARPEFAESFPHFTPENWTVFLDRVRKLSKYLRIAEPVFPLERDPKDAKYIDLAVSVEADYLITYDRDLLDLMKGIDDISKEFRQRFRHLKVVRPDEFLKVISETELTLAP